LENVPRPPQDFEFGDVRVEAGAHRLLRQGTVVAVEPKAFAVLLELLAQPGQLVGRDALLDAVWGHRHVTPAVLNRVIAMLRKAIGDDAEAPQCIQTVHGLGYRFVAPVRTAATATDGNAQPRNAGSPAASNPATALPAAGVTTEIEPARTAAPAAPVAPVIAVATGSGDRRRGPSRLLALVAIVALLALAWTAWRQARTPPLALVAPPIIAPAGRAIDATQAPVVAVLPLRVSPADPDTLGVAQGLAESIGEMLDRLAGVRVSARESVDIAVARAADPLAAGRLLGADFVLHGELGSATGGSMALDLSLLRVVDGATAWSSAYQQPRDQMFRVMGPTFDGVQGVLRPAVPVAGDVLFKASDSAQELYWRARQLQRPPRAATAMQAIELLERALAIDPEFGLAYCSLAYAWRNSAFTEDADLQLAIARAQDALARALAIDPNLMCAHLGTAFLLTLQWRAPQAQVAIDRALAIDPDNVDALSIAANLAMYQGRPRDALAMHREAQARDPLNPAPRVMHWYVLALLGRTDEALATLAEGIPGFERQTTLVPRVLLSRGRLAEAIRAMRSIPEEMASDLYVRLVRVAALDAIGDVGAAATVLANVPEGRSRPPIYGEVRARLFWHQGRYPDALAWIESADGVLLADPWRHVLRAHTRALLGDEAGALADYGAAFATETDQLTVGYSWYPLHFGLAELANWAALRAMQGQDPAPAGEAYARILRGMIDGGVALPAIDYLQALGAALDGDAVAADRLLGVALERGWRDPIALSVDLPWRRFRGAPWLQARREQLDALIAAERAALASDPPLPRG